MIVVPLLGMSKVRFIVVNLFSNTLLELHEILLLQMYKMIYKLIQKITYLFVCHYLFLFKSLSFIISCFIEWWNHLKFHSIILMQSSVKCCRIHIKYLKMCAKKKYARNERLCIRLFEYDLRFFTSPKLLHLTPARHSKLSSR